MAENEQGAEKTEAPTQRRREDAREKGQRLNSRELSTALSVVAGAVWLWNWGPDLGALLMQSLREGLSLSAGEHWRQDPVERIWVLVMDLLMPMLALAGIVLLVILVGQIGLGGLSFNLTLIQPKMSRLNPMNGFKRMFGKQGLVELSKAALKAALIGAISWWLLSSSLPFLAGLSAIPLEAAIPAVGAKALTLFMWLCGGLLLIAAIDVPVQAKRWIEQLKMSKQEVIDEAKQQEGSAEVKQAIRRMARDAMKRANRQQIGESTVVLTNPTHFAVALRYRPGEDAAPVIMARGRGLVAEVIRELAAESGVPILSYPSVARSIYFTGRVGTVIKPELYAAVATILAFVLRVGGGAVQPDAEAPIGTRFDERGVREDPQ